MIKQTKALQQYQTVSQAHIDFVVLACHAVPFLKRRIEAGDASPQPDHFHAPTTSEVLTRLAGHYQDPLARTTVLSLFSYFERYVRALFVEIVEFHGGETKMVGRSDRRGAKAISLQAPAREAKAKLQEHPKAGKRDKYLKYSAVLTKSGFQFPSQLFAHYGLRQFVDRALDPQLKAYALPELAEHGLLFPFTEIDKRLMNRVRSLRNEVGHGRLPAITLKQALADGSELHKVAMRLDRHAIDRFLVIEEFA